MTSGGDVAGSIVQMDVKCGGRVRRSNGCSQSSSGVSRWKLGRRRGQHVVVRGSLGDEGDLLEINGT